MVILDDVQEWLDLVFPPSLAEEWDNIGLQVGDPQAAVTRVTVALDPTREVIQAAVASGSNLVLTHHPLLFPAISQIDLSRPIGGAIATALRGGCAVVAAHTNADAATAGVADVLADVIGMHEDRIALAPIGDEDDGVGAGRCGALIDPVTAQELADRAAQLLGASPRIVGDPSRRVERLAVCGGSGARYIDAARRAGADAYLTGEVKHHDALDALGSDMPVIDAGHYATEAPWVPVTAETLRAAFPELEVEVSPVRTDPFQGAA